MHSFLIVSKNKKTSLDFTALACKKNQIDKFDVALFTFQKAIGIEDVRNLQKKIFLKPIRSKTKAIVFDSYSGLTISAQNALLKLLEEPPANTIIYIISPNKELFLPTILSRCKIIELKDPPYKLSDEENAQYLNILISLIDKSVGEKLKLAQDLAKNKDEVIPWLEKMIVVARDALIMQIMKNDKINTLPLSFWGVPRSVGATPESPATMRDSGQARMTGFQINSKYLNILISLSKTYTIISTTNANQRLVLENLFLSL